jgi:hypothetical protein
VPSVVKTIKQGEESWAAVDRRLEASSDLEKRSSHYGGVWEEHSWQRHSKCKGPEQEQ